MAVCSKAQGQVYRNSSFRRSGRWHAASNPFGVRHAFVTWNGAIHRSHGGRQLNQRCSAPATALVSSHDPGLVRRHSLDSTGWGQGQIGSTDESKVRPEIHQRLRAGLHSLAHRSHGGRQQTGIAVLLQSQSVSLHDLGLVRRLSPGSTGWGWMAEGFVQRIQCKS